MDRLLDLLIKTFATTTISIWTFRAADRRFCQIRSVTAEKEPITDRSLASGHHEAAET